MITLAAAVGIVSTYPRVLPSLETSFQAELAQALPQIQRHTEPDAVLYARKRHIPFETGLRGRMIPMVDTLGALRGALCSELEPHDRAYLYFGTAERQYRAALGTELQAPNSVPWLQPVAQGARTGWGLYRIKLFDSQLPAPRRCAPLSAGTSSAHSPRLRAAAAPEPKRSHPR
jgi:hypothetical protein